MTGCWRDIYERRLVYAEYEVQVKSGHKSLGDINIQLSRFSCPVIRFRRTSNFEETFKTQHHFENYFVLLHFVLQSYYAKIIIDRGLGFCGKTSHKNQQVEEINI